MFLHEYLPFIYVIFEKYNYNRHSTTEYDNIAYTCSSNMPTNENHSKTVIYNYF